MDELGDVTIMLKEVGRGSRVAVDRLLPLVYDELRRLAQSRLQLERPDHTLQATALVHEAYLKLIDQTRVEWQDRAHFFAVAAQAIRRILVDYARRRGRVKRGGGQVKLSLDEAPTLLMAADDQPAADLLALDRSLTRFAAEHPEKAKVVELRFFGGLSGEETAKVLGITSRSVRRYWSFAQAWLYRDMTTAGTAGHEG
jgi:RNA polymerase sigma factor (TIGR02999 family)